jgi:hypothetical protein
MSFRILEPEVMVLKSLGENKDNRGNVIGYEHESVTRFKDEIIDDSEVSPMLIELYDKGDKHVRSIMVRLDKDNNPVDDVPEPKEAPAPDVIPAKGGDRKRSAVRQSDEGE